jgi:hypothetical protein
MVQGLQAEGLRPWSLGYVYLPRFALIVVTSMLLAPAGARMAYRLPLKPLRILLGLVLLGLALRTLVSLW